MAHLFLLRDVFDLLNDYDFDEMPKTTKEKLRAMRNRISDYIVSQGHDISYIGYPPDEKVVLLRAGVVMLDTTGQSVPLEQ